MSAEPQFISVDEDCRAAVCDGCGQACEVMAGEWFFVVDGERFCAECAPDSPGGA